MFSTFIALCPNIIVLVVSPRCLGDGPIVTTNDVSMYLPPNESLSNLVSFESRTGTCGLFSASALMHFPSALRDKLIDFASSNV
ncbi:Os06g0137166 [Oryza sativa Japonica Group]|uniref:Os06g0137166 protein n=1 Tax=Oryza sativa subsp. japonica TaxID=39947 RepID=A0A0P0WS67_ORYSJ|nr:hypothetical protein EE612_031799 [Oryza sativa]BAS96042.1 Os06g0137166 [Oryza sativa Japonica Group]